jgi:hypothetical protein
MRTSTCWAARERSGRSRRSAGLDRLELLVLPVLLGDGLRLTDATSQHSSLRLLRSGWAFPDGTTELVYAPS